MGIVLYTSFPRINIQVLEGLREKELNIYFRYKGHTHSHRRRAKQRKVTIRVLITKAKN